MSAWSGAEAFHAPLLRFSIVVAVLQNQFREGFLEGEACADIPEALQEDPEGVRGPREDEGHRREPPGPRAGRDLGNQPRTHPGRTAREDGGDEDRPRRAGGLWADRGERGRHCLLVPLQRVRPHGVRLLFAKFPVRPRWEIGFCFHMIS